MENRKQKKLPKILLRIGIILFLFIAVLLLGVRFYFRFPVSSYYKTSEKAFLIPGLKDGFIAQGLAYEDGKYYVTGYMKDGSASPIYIVEESTGDCIQTVYQYTKDLQPYAGHCGGIEVNGKYIYVASGKGLCIYDRSTVETVSDHSNVPYIGTFSTMGENEDYVGVAWLTKHDNELVVGEFYREANYPTPENHKLTTPAGDRNQALALIYEFSEDEDSLYGIKPVPKAAYSLPDQVQGVAFSDGKLYCSTSYATPFSHILEYDLGNAGADTISFMNQDLPVSYMDSSNLLRDIKFPPMSEEIVFVNDRLVTMCESASNKYIFGKFTSAKWCYATDLTAN